MYIVYCHITPDEMFYIGKTKNIKSRWYPVGYKTTSLQPYIEKYGWENIRHVVLKDGLTEDQALVLECLLIDEATRQGFCINKQRSGMIWSDNYKEYLKIYNQRPDVKERRHEYNQRPEVKERQREYKKRPEVQERERERKREYEQLPEVKQRRREYDKKRNQTEKRKEYKHEYNQRPEVKEHKREYQREYQKTEKYKEYQRQYRLKKKALKN